MRVLLTIFILTLSVFSHPADQQFFNNLNYQMAVIHEEGAQERYEFYKKSLNKDKTLILELKEERKKVLKIRDKADAELKKSEKKLDSFEVLEKETTGSKMHTKLADQRAESIKRYIDSAEESVTKKEEILENYHEMLLEARAKTAEAKRKNGIKPIEMPWKDEFLSSLENRRGVDNFEYSIELRKEAQAFFKSHQETKATEDLDKYFENMLKSTVASKFFFIHEMKVSEELIGETRKILRESAQKDIFKINPSAD